MELLMTDETTRPDNTDEPATQPATQPAAQPVAQPAAQPVAQPDAQPVAPVPARWWTRRVPLLIIAAALLLGCVLGAGVVAVAALVVGDHHGDDRGYSNRDERGGRPGPGNWGPYQRGGAPGGPGFRGGRPVPAPPTAAATPSAGASAPASVTPTT
jgi:hypothetical protein